MSYYTDRRRQRQQQQEKISQLATQVEQVTGVVLPTPDPTKPGAPVTPRWQSDIERGMQAVIDSQQLLLRSYAEINDKAQLSLQQATLKAADTGAKNLVEPLAGLLRDSLAYATYRDTQYTAAASLTLPPGTRTRLTNTGTVLQSTRPAKEQEWLRTNKLYPGYAGDTYQIRINCTVESTSALALELENELIFPPTTGAAALPLEIISTAGRTVGTRLGAMAKKLSFYHTVYCGERFLANGCEVHLTANTLQGALPVGMSLRIYDISFALFRFRQGVTL